MRARPLRARTPRALRGTPRPSPARRRRSPAAPARAGSVRGRGPRTTARRLARRPAPPRPALRVLWRRPWPSEAGQPGCRGRLVLALDRERDRERALLLAVRAEQRIGTGLEHERDVVAGICAPDDEVAGLHGALRDVAAVLQHRPRVRAAAEGAAVRVDLRTGPPVAEGRKARAVGVERQLARVVHRVDRPQLLVVDRRFVRDPPPGDLDNLGPQARLARRLLEPLRAARLVAGGQRFPLEVAGQLRAERLVADALRVAEQPL